MWEGVFGFLWGPRKILSGRKIVIIGGLGAANSDMDSESIFFYLPLSAKDTRCLKPESDPDPNNWGHYVPEDFIEATTEVIINFFLSNSNVMSLVTCLCLFLLLLFYN